MLSSLQGTAPIANLPGLGVDSTVSEGPRRADLNAPVTSAVARPTAGLNPTALPALMDDWRAATLDESAWEFAIMENRPLIQRAVRQVEQQLERPLERFEISEIARQTVEPYVAAVAARLTTTDQQRAQTIADALKRHRGRVASLRDPFTPIIRNQPGARDNERVLWESSSILIIADQDRFSPMGPKVLVMPKAALLFPSDASDSQMRELAQVARTAGNVMAAVGNSPRPAQIWINAPQNLTVKQLHVHVRPDVQWNLELPPEQVARQRDAFYARVSGELAARLGPSS